MRGGSWAPLVAPCAFAHKHSVCANASPVDDRASCIACKQWRPAAKIESLRVCADREYVPALLVRARNESLITKQGADAHANTVADGQREVSRRPAPRGAWSTAVLWLTYGAAMCRC